ncbi:hypothetical protein PINS_up001760 [Pythium insidiosum]|nr:hypothetical protein PINS_up001760 [Pythium insidiosum]
MQLRQQKTTSALREQSSSSEAPGPPDELVEVRFTFSRGRGRFTELATPNGISGQFSPAVELERTLEILADEQLTPAVVLEEPLTSRLDGEDGQNDDAGRVVFEVLQSCIDIIATHEEHDEECRDHPITAKEEEEEEEEREAKENARGQNEEVSKEVEAKGIEAQDVVVLDTLQEQVESCAAAADKAEVCTTLADTAEPVVESTLTAGDVSDLQPEVDVGENDHEFDDDEFELPSPTPRASTEHPIADDANEAPQYEDDLEPQAEEDDEDDPYAADDFSD